MEVHECVLRTYPSIPITALSFSHPRTESSTQAQNARLAVGRENGDIEIWNPFNWYQEKIIRGGGSERAIDGLTWAVDPDWTLDDGKFVGGAMRLFSIGLTSTITEWDIAKGVPRRHAFGYHGEIWCLASLPPSAWGGKVTRLIAGTNKGELVMYSIEDDQLRFEKVLSRPPNRSGPGGKNAFQITSLACRDARIIIAGCSDNSIRIFNLRSGSQVKRVTVNARRGNMETIVWSVKCLPDGDIVSADEGGQISIWDARTLTLAQSLLAHTDHVVCLTVSSDGQTIVTGGNDARSKVLRKRSEDGIWDVAQQRRHHSAEIKAMAAFESGGRSVVVSGGVDGALVLSPLQKAGEEYHRRLPHVPHVPQAISAPKARLVVSWEGSEVRIHSIALRWQECGDLFSQGDNLKLVGGLRMAEEDNITSVATNKDGTFLVVAQASSGIKAFHLIHKGNPCSSEDLEIRRVDVPDQLAQSRASLLTISPDSRWLSLVADSSNVLVAKIDEGHEFEGVRWVGSIGPKLQTLKRLKRDIPRDVALDPLYEYRRTITKVTFSPDGNILVAADLGGYIDVWELKATTHNGTDKLEDDASDSSDDESIDGKQDDVLDWKKHWTLPGSSSGLPQIKFSIAALSVNTGVKYPQLSTKDNSTKSPTDQYTLLVVTAPFNVLAFNPLTGALCRWSRHNNFVHMPPKMADSVDCIKGIIWHGPRAWIYGFSSLFMLNLSVDTGVIPTLAKLHRKRKAPNSGAGDEVHDEDVRFKARKVQKTTTAGGKVEKLEEKSVVAESFEGELEFFDYDSGARGELQKLRGCKVDGDGDGKEVVAVNGTGLSGRRRPYLETFRYRHVMGVVPLGDPAVGDDPDQPLEVAIVEWPFGQNLPDRWEERSKKK